MRLAHFEKLRPVCPVCRASDGESFPLDLGAIDREARGHVIEGVLHCTNPRCRHEFPIIDGIPVIVPGLRDFVSNQVLPILARRDLGPSIESLVGDCCGPASSYETTRQHLNNYAWGHYADLDPAEQQPAGSILPLVQAVTDLAGTCLREGPLIDVGCSVGRSTFELAARAEDLVLGVDLNFAMLRLAGEVLRESRVCYPRRRVGIVYDRREFAAEFAGTDRVDFWACDALALPLADASLGAAASLNLLDCVSDPRGLLVELARVLHPGGRAVFGCPYDWSHNATAPQAWVGGHSQRSPAGGSSEAILRALLTPGGHPSAVEGFELRGERDDLPWRVRLHDRSAVCYRVHMVAAQRR